MADMTATRRVLTLCFGIALCGTIVGEVSKARGNGGLSLECAGIGAGAGSVFGSDESNVGFVVIGESIAGNMQGPQLTLEVGIAACVTGAVPRPRLIGVLDGLASVRPLDLTTFVSSKSALLGVGSVTIAVSEEVELVDACLNSTGGSPPGSASLVALDRPGLYRVEFSDVIELAEWTTVNLSVVSAAGIRSDLCFRVAHLPGDIDGNGQVNLADATAFGIEFHGDQTLGVVDLNDDGQVSLTDATKFGQIVNGTSGEGISLDGSGGWLGAGLPAELPDPCR